MVQLVFVHGVTVRKNDSYDNDVSDRDRRFQQHAFAGQAVTIANPYWGEYGAPARFTCIPKFSTSYVALNLGDDDLNEDRPNDVFLRAARADFPAVVGALSAASLQILRAAGNEQALLKEEMFWAGAAKYAELSSSPAWLNEIETDENFFDKLNAEANAQQTMVALGLVSSIKDAAASLAGGVSNLVNSPFGKFGRDVLTPHIAVFVGDVFRYLKDGVTRSSIRERIVADIAASASASAATGEKLVLVGHSMGAVILYDMLSDTTFVESMSVRIGKPLKVDLFLSIGSQIALFEELRVFEASSSAPPNGVRTPKPACVDRWWNVFDKMDVLSFVVEPVFSNSNDFAVDTIAGVKDAHGAYFSSMVFYNRLNKRLSDAGLL